MPIALPPRAYRASIIAPRRGSFRRFALALLLSCASFGALAQSFITPIDDPPPDPDPNYSQTLIEQGAGWQLVETRGVIDDSAQAYAERTYMIDGIKGLAEAPLPRVIKDELINDLAALAEGEQASFSISQSIVAEIERSLAQGAPTDALIALSEHDDIEPLRAPGKSGAVPLGSCGDRDILRNKHFDINAPLNGNFNIGSGFSGSLALTGSANVNADGEIKITLKRTRIWFLCIPYGVKFRHARAWGSAQVEQGATLSGTIQYANPQAREWPIAKPRLFTLDFMAGPIPVHIGFNLPITAGFDQGGITGSVTGSVTYSGRRTVYGTFDYACTPSGCGGSSNFDTTDLGSQPLTAGISGRFQPNVYVQVAIRGYLYGEGFAYAQVGVRPYLRGDLWGYYGNNCGDADGDGYYETVDALTFDLDWQLYITAQADTFLTNQWNGTLWSSPRWHVGFWDFLGGQSGSSALTPMLIGPSGVPLAAPQVYSARMRSCWPYSENVDYVLDWGDGLTQPLNGPAAALTSASHAWLSPGTPTLQLTATRDAHGRNLNRVTRRTITVSATPFNLALSAYATASSTYCHGTGTECYRASRINDGSNATTLGGLESWVNDYGQAMPQWVQLSWQGPVTFSRIEFYTTSGYELRDFVVQRRVRLPLGITLWIDLPVTPAFPTNNGSTHLSFAMAPVTTDAIRVLARSGSASQPGYARVNELEVYP